MVNGIINIYKEKGFTSFDVVAKMRGMFHQKKIGHTGTLDPDAEGVLPVCLGKATKVCDLLTDKDKEYEAVLLLGIQTDTLDISGQVINQSDDIPSEEEVRNVINSFVGDIMQIPPMYSALKVNGQKLCNLARQGIVIERQPRPVTIHEIEILEIKLPEIRMRISCSKGTYIRTLCDDIGMKLGCYGTMKSLIRTKVSCFSVENAIKLSDLQGILENGEETNYIHSVDSLFMHYPKVCVRKEFEKALLNGNRIPFEGTEQMDDPGEVARVYDWNDKFIGLYNRMVEDGDYKPLKLFMD